MITAKLLKLRRARAVAQQELDIAAKAHLEVREKRLEVGRAYEQELEASGFCPICEKPVAECKRDHNLIGMAS